MSFYIDDEKLNLKIFNELSEESDVNYANL